jgi:hypothetical protein
MLKDIEEKLETKRKQLEKLKLLENEVNNLEATKKNLEALLASKPAPPEWEKFVKHIETYHHYYHYYYPPYPYPYYPVLNPWWTYTITSGNLILPQENAIYVMNPNSYSGNFQITNSTPVITTNSVPITTATSESISGISGITYNSSTIGSGSLNSIGGLNGSYTFTNTVGSSSQVPPIVYNNYIPSQKEAEEFKEAEKFLKDIGFFIDIEEVKSYLTSIGWELPSSN